MNFIVRNRSQIEAGYCPEGRSILITITDPDKVHAIPSNDFYSIFEAKFDDADVWTSSKTVLIDDATAKRILGFVNTMVTYEIENVVVNCEAGLSRSAGMAAALSYIYTGSDKDIIRQKPMYNRTVYRTIMNAYFEGYR